MTVWMSGRAGFDIAQGTGWIRPIVMWADWPLGEISVDETGIHVAAGFLFPMCLDIPWDAITDVRQTWLGMELTFINEAEHHDLAIRALFIWSRFERCLEEHGQPIPHQCTDTEISH